MGVGKKKTSVRPKAKKMMSKKELVKKRVSRLMKLVEYRKKLKK
jgi:hypothetical protein